MRNLVRMLAVALITAFVGAGVASAQAETAATKTFTLQPGGKATVSYEAFCLDFGKKFPGSVNAPNGVADAKIQNALYYALTKGYQSSEALDLQYANWELTEAQNVPQSGPVAAEIKAGNINFDVVIASPDTMRVVGTLGQILGPRGLMPNPKVGTVTPDVATAVRNAKAGQVQFRVDKAGIIHATIGRRSFESDKLAGNLRALIEALNKAKPASSKGVYLRKVAVSSTMGVGARVDVASINAAPAQQ